MNTVIVRISKETFIQLKAWQAALRDSMGYEKSMVKIIDRIVYDYFDGIMKRQEENKENVNKLQNVNKGKKQEVKYEQQ